MNRNLSASSGIPKKKWSTRFRKLLKWAGIGMLGYFLLTTVYFGYGDLDERTGVCRFYWSGLDDLGSKTKASGFLINRHFTTFLKGLDGPYLLGDSIFSVDKNNRLQTSLIDSSRRIPVFTGIPAFPVFWVQVKERYEQAPDHYGLPEKLLALSDIEGNLTGLYSLLLNNGVVDEKGNWIYGKGDLVLNGDLFDRGNQVPQLLWWVYHLENQAIAQGGRVHFILGNHEISNLKGFASDNDFKYIEVARRISGQQDWDKAVRYLYSEETELGRWLRTKNIVEKIGDYLFVHGGLNLKHVQQQLDITSLNSIARKYFGNPKVRDLQLPLKESLVVDAVNSPYWDRGLNMDWKVRWAYWFSGKSAKATAMEELEKILDFFQAKTIVIGHSPVSDISTGYQRKVIRLDVAHGEVLHSGRTRGLLLEAGRRYRINDAGLKEALL